MKTDDGEGETFAHLLDHIDDEKKKNRILLMIFVAGVIGFVILVVNRPAMKHA